MTGTQAAVAFTDLRSADLRVDAIYQGGRAGNSGDDPLNSLLKVSLMGGFRYRGSLDTLELVVLTTTMSDSDWPDEIDRETGVFTYYGDNKKPGRALHETPRHGNEILRQLFAMAHGTAEDRRRLPPVLVFASSGTWRDMIFVGLAVPGTSDLRASEDLVAIWKIGTGRRFQNYRARFTIIDAPVVSRAWIKDIIAGNPRSANAPQNWMSWIESGERRTLLATRSKEHRRKSEQLPGDEDGRAIIRILHQWFSDRPDVAALDVTRPSRDGGRDAIGQLRIGRGPSSILVDFAIEAKCYQMSSSVGVRDVCRLISRLRHRQFGILVTTSYLEPQVYQDIKEDRHPIIVLAAVDIVDFPRANGRSDGIFVQEWLQRDYPRGT